MWFEQDWDKPEARVQFSSHGYFAGEWPEDEAFDELVSRFKRECEATARSLLQWEESQRKQRERWEKTTGVKLRREWEAFAGVKWEETAIY